MLGQALLRACPHFSVEPLPTDLPELDLSQKAELADFLDRQKPDHIIHCAAYTNVDGAESDEETCRKVNGEIPAILGKEAARRGIPVLMISTDFVFDGESREPYPVTAPPRPLSVYGRTKRQGEEALLATADFHQIARTAWLYGPGKGNFVSAMRDRLLNNQPLRVVDDQWGCPTCTLDLAPALLELARTRAPGIFHLTNSGKTTWCRLTRAIAAHLGKNPEEVAAIATEEYPVPAQRPKWSVLDCSRAWEAGVKPMASWEEGLRHYLHWLETRGNQFESETSQSC